MADTKDVALYVIGAGLLILSGYWAYILGVGVIAVTLDSDLPVLVRVGIALMGFGIVAVLIYLIAERVRDAKKENEYFEKNKQ